MNVQMWQGWAREPVVSGTEGGTRAGEAPGRKRGNVFMTPWQEEFFENGANKRYLLKEK